MRRRAVAAVAAALGAACTDFFASAALTDTTRTDMIARFLTSRSRLDVACLYTFDKFTPPSNVSASSKIDVDDTVLSNDPPTFPNHLGHDCPFGDLQFDPDLVTSLDDGATTMQLGVQLAPDQNNDICRPQIASSDVVAAKEFFSTAMDHGFSVEFTYRRRIETNQSMTLFSISNRFRSCVDPGFRVDIIPTQVMMLIFFYPVLVGNDIACYERRLFSARIGNCVLPNYRQTVDENPVVHVVITVKGVHADFFIKFVDPATEELYECHGRDTAPLPDEPITYDYIQGSYRLFIGNNPRNVSSPLSRSSIARIRQYRDPKWDDRPPEERLRDMIKQKLDSIDGPRVPASFRLFGGKSVSFSVFGVPLPPVSEDTPFKWIRDKITDFKQEHGDEIVDFIVKGLKEANDPRKIGSNLDYDSSQSDTNDGNSSAQQQGHTGIYPNANSSAFDLFHFVMYKSPITASSVREHVWSKWMMPFRPFLGTKAVVRVDEDEEAVLDLLQLHSIYDDIKLELLGLPKRGKVLLFSNRSELTQANLHTFRALPIEKQQKVIFVPSTHQVYDGVGGSELFMGADCSTIRYHANASVVGRLVNTTREAVIDISVNPIRTPLTTRHLTRRAHDGVPVYINLVGTTTSSDDNTSGTPTYSRNLGLFDDLTDSGRDEAHNSTGRVEQNDQIIVITQLPKYGHLYDQQMENLPKLEAANAVDSSQTERYRIRQDMIVNQTFSPFVVYVFDSSTIEIGSRRIDKLEYKLLEIATPGEGVTSIVNFELLPRLAKSYHDTYRDIAHVHEDSATVISLSSYELLLPGTRIKIQKLPTHGALYQWPNRQQINISLGLTGRLIKTSGDIVTDVSGRVLYVPDHDYFNAFGTLANNAWTSVDKEFDDFNFSISRETDFFHQNLCAIHSPTSQNSLNVFSKIRLQVDNVPDKLAVLPPTLFTTNSISDDAVNVPVAFIDPDRYSGMYEVTLQGSDDKSEFEIGHPFINDDVLKYCPLKVPCWLIRSANRSFISDDQGDEREDEDWQLLHRVEKRYWNPSFIDIRARKRALQYALGQLRFRERRWWKRSAPHSAHFRFTIKRADSPLDCKLTMTYCLSYIPSKSDTASDSVGQALSNLTDLVSFVLWLAGLCFILSSASCCSTGFCCCFTRAKEKKRQQFNDDRRRYLEQVVQNDYEYTPLLVALQSIVARPDVSVSLIRACGTGRDAQRTRLQVFCLLSVTPFLKQEQNELSFIRYLISAEIKESPPQSLDTIFMYPSVAGLALTRYLAECGMQWIRDLQSSLFDGIDYCEDIASRLLTVLEIMVWSLPKEVCCACQQLAELISPACERGNTLEAIHVVFFNHFVGPSLWSIKRERHIQNIRIGIASIACRRLSKFNNSRYTLILGNVLAASFTPTASIAACKVDEKLIMACLMNVHSILDLMYRDFVLEEKECRADVWTATFDDVVDFRGTEELTPSVMVWRLLRALNFPLANCDILLQASWPTLQRQEGLWTSFSAKDWGDRLEDVEVIGAKPPQRKLQQSRSLLSVDFIHDEDTSDTCPSRVELEF